MDNEVGARWACFCALLTSYFEQRLAETLDL